MLTFKKFINEETPSKQVIIKLLSGVEESNPIFDEVYKVLMSSPMSEKIESYIKLRKDPDAIENIKYLIKTIPTLGTTSEIKDFLELLTPVNNKTHDFIDIEKLCPAKGMFTSANLSSVVSNPFAKKLFDKLVDDVTGKKDAGPGEAALAILSTNITFAQGKHVGEHGAGGDLIINGIGKVEVKGGTGGGRLASSKIINQKDITDSLKGYNLTSKGITPIQLSSKLPEGFPIKEFMKAMCKERFGGNKLELINSVGTPKFKEVWLKLMYDEYKESSGFKSMLFISNHKYQYVISGDQIPINYVSNWGYVYYPGGKQGGRELFPQISPK